jgi:hypothetical protein
MRLRSVVLLSLLAACDGGAPAPSNTGTEPAATPEAADKAPDVKFDLATLQAEAKPAALVPSPVEMQKALSAAGISTRLATLVSARNIETVVPDKNAAAVRTGVVLADLVLTVKDAQTSQIVAQLNRVKQGLNALGGSADLSATIDDLSNRLTNDAISRDDLIKELDELRGVMVPAGSYELGDNAVPLILAGSWVEGSHLVAAAMKAENKYEGADNLLKQPAVVDYFLGYVKTEGASQKAPNDLVAKLESTLDELKIIAAKPTLGKDDVDKIHAATGEVLALL